MNWGTEFNFTFEPPAPLKTEIDLYAVPRLTETPHDNHSVKALNPHNGKSAVLPLEVANALTYCNRFRTLEEHVSEFVGDAAPNDPRRPAIKELLEQVQEGGLMISGQELLAKLSKTASVAPANEAISAAIITCDRPRALARLLESIARNCRLTSVRELIIIDDSRSHENQRRNQEAAEQRQADFGHRLRYFGADEAQRYTNQLVRKIPHLEHEIRFLLDREKWSEFYSAGVARNWSHVLSIGRKVAVFDDDTVCELWRSSFGEGGCELNPPRRQALFFGTLEDEQRLSPSPDEDPISSLTDCLGLTLAQAFDALSLGRPTLDALRHADPDAVVNLSAESRILVSECGSVGDPGTADYKWLLRLPDESLQRMVDEPGQADRALAHDRCWLGAEKVSFATEANMSQLTGFDNRQVLPPYMPVDRGQDRIFGEMVQFLYPGSVSLNHNWAIKHLRVNPETAQGEAGRAMGSMSWLTNLTLAPARRMDECASSRFSERLQTLSQFFLELADMENHEIAEQATVELEEKNRFQAEEIQRRLDLFPDLPASMRRHMQEMAARYEVEVMPAKKRLEDSAEALRFWKQTWKDFGKALAAWPEIRAAATTLQETRQ